MKTMRSPLKYYFQYFLNRSFIRHAPVSISFILLISTSCAEKKMTLQEAKQVTVSIQGKSFVPPRCVDDILDVLDQKGQFDPKVVEKLKGEADLLPPDTDDPSKLALFYRERGLRARDLSRWKQYLEDLRKALEYCEKAKKKGGRALDDKEHAWLLLSLSVAEAKVGNFGKAISLIKQSINIAAFNPARKYRLLACYYFFAKELKAGEEATQIGVRICDNKLNKANISEELREVYSAERALLLSGMLDATGKYKKSEPYLRVGVHLFDKRYPTKNRKGYFSCKRGLAMNLAYQGRFVEAEIELRDVLKETIGLSGRDSIETGITLADFGVVLSLQGRDEDAQKLVMAAISNLEASGISRDSSVYYWAIGTLCNILVAKGNFVDAAEQLDLMMNMAAQHENQYFFNRLGQNPSFMLTLLKTGRLKEAMGYINEGIAKSMDHLGGKNYRTAEMLGLRGMASSLMGNDEEAMTAFSVSIPILLGKKTSARNYPTRQRLRIIVESYLDLLGKIHESSQKDAFHIDAPKEIFKISVALNRNVVQDALGASGARAAADSSQLADLVRKEQDAAKQIEAFTTMLSDALAFPTDQRNPQSLAELKSSLDSLSTARQTILDEIEWRFPKYADLIHPKTPDFITVQANLKPNEAMIVLYPSQEKIYAWGIPEKGDVAFAVVPLGKDDLQEKALRLRQTLSPVPKTFGKIPEFNVDLAYDLYSYLLKPIEAGWKSADDLIIVSPGPLGQIPFSLFPTEPFQPNPEEELLFEHYREAPWLIKNFSLTRLPSVSSLITLRNIPEGEPDRKAFLGFGDPYFNIEQMKEDLGVNRNRDCEVSNRLISQRGVRALFATGANTLDNEELISSHIGMLSRLPDTAEEITVIAEALEADLTQDIFLGEKATERQVKRMDMSDRKVVAFATHGLIPGDLDGLDQPALALCSPDVAQDDEDGLLTMGEILKLKMNADWVVLSACNSGAAGGKGTEAISGLGRAFFYAGSRALLVTMWPVETTSAKKLTTVLFLFQKNDPALSKARALQKSMLDLMEKGVLKDGKSGKLVASYAHPFFWAPFIIVGDGS
jgi:CHAT domain-containing protein